MFNRLGMQRLHIRPWASRTTLEVFKLNFIGRIFEHCFIEAKCEEAYRFLVERFKEVTGRENKRNRNHLEVKNISFSPIGASKIGRSEINQVSVRACKNVSAKARAQIPEPLRLGCPSNLALIIFDSITYNLILIELKRW